MPEAAGIAREPPNFYAIMNWGFQHVRELSWEEEIVEEMETEDAGNGNSYLYLVLRDAKLL